MAGAVERPGAQGVGRLSARVGDAVDQQKQGRGRQRAVDHIEQASRHGGGLRQAHRQQQRAGRADDQVADLRAQLLRRQRADRCQRDGRQRQRRQPRPGHPGRRATVLAEDQRADAQHAVHAHLGHHGEQRRCRGTRRAVGRRQPEIQRQQRGLDEEHHQQQQGGALQQQPPIRRQMGHALCHVRHVQRAGQSVQQTHGDQEQRRAGEVEADIVQRRPQPRQARAVQQQAIGRDQQDFEEHEQVEQVGGQESAVQAHQLKLEQGVEVRAAPVITAAGVEQGRQCDAGGQRQHQRRQPVQEQRDAERRCPVAHQVGLHIAAIGLLQEGDRHRQQDRRGRDADTGRHERRAAAEQHQQ